MMPLLQYPVNYRNIPNTTKINNYGDVLYFLTSKDKNNFHLKFYIFTLKCSYVLTQWKSKMLQQFQSKFWI